MVNCWEANKLADWCNIYGFRSKITNVSFTKNILISNLEPSWKNQLIETFKNSNWELTNSNEIAEITSVINNSKFDVSTFIAFKNYLSTIDKIRNLNYKKTFPILDEYIQDVSKKYSC
jgi:hypothetical protein